MAGANNAYSDIYQYSSPPFTRPSSPRTDVNMQTPEYVSQRTFRPVDGDKKTSKNMMTPQKSGLDLLMEVAQTMEQSESPGPTKRLKLDHHPNNENSQMISKAVTTWPFHIKSFVKEADAKDYCKSNTLKHIGIAKGANNTYEVYSIDKDQHFLSKYLPADHEWLYIKAYAPEVNNQKGLRGNYCLLRLQGTVIDTKSNNQGVIRMTMKMPDNIWLKLHFHSCRHVDPNNMCSVCQHMKWNGKCCKGEEFYAASFR